MGISSGGLSPLLVFFPFSDPDSWWLPLARGGCLSFLSFPCHSFWRAALWAVVVAVLRSPPPNARCEESWRFPMTGR